MSVAVVGVGAVGGRVARHLLGGDDAIVVHDVNQTRLDEVVASLGSGATTVRPGEREADVVAGALADRGVRVTVLATPAGQQRALATALVSRGISVVSVGDDVDDVRGLLDLDAEATERGVSLVIGAGFSPGLTCLLARHAADTFDRVDEVHVARVGTGGPACARQHHRALAGESLDWRDDGWVRRRAGSGRELCWFPDPLGGRDCYRAALPDAVLLVRALDGVERVTARLGANRRDRLTARLPMLRAPHNDGGPGGVRVEVRGARGDARDVVVYGAMDHPAVAAATVAAVAVLAVKGVVPGLRRPGAGGLAELTDPLPLLRALAERGTKAAIFTGTT